MTLRPRIKQLHQLHHASDCVFGDVSMFTNPRKVCSAESSSPSNPMVLTHRLVPMKVLEGHRGALKTGIFSSKDSMAK